MLAGILSFWKHLSSQLKQWIKPTTVTLVRGTIADMTRSRTDLLVENAIVRQQLMVLNRQVKRPQLTNSDRLRLVFLARCTGC
jgi:hypothetical protein